MPDLSTVLEVVGAVSALYTALAALFPKGSPAGKLFGKIGADLKGHNK